MALIMKPETAAMVKRHQRVDCSGRLVKYFGSFRNTSTRITKVTVSTRVWVRARSGAP